MSHFQPYMAKINYASNGKRDFHNLEYESDKAIHELEANETWKHDNNRLIVLDYLKACRLGKAKSGNKNKKVVKSTLYRVMGLMRMLSNEWINKDFDKTTQKDWDDFYENMENDVIINAYGNKYKPSAKAKSYKTVRKFLKWKFGENKYYPPFCDSWDTTEESPTKIFLTRSEVEKMVLSASALRVKTYIMALFDGGFRAEEFANLRWVDVAKPEDRGYYKAHVRKETSKTKKERWVSLWLATDLIDNFKNSEKQRLGDNFDENNFIFETNYHTMLETIKDNAKKVLNKDISLHTMRHSSATYYASIIKTYAQFCSRYGWNLKSGTAQRYFHAVDDDEIAGQTKDHEIAKFKTEFEKTKLENKIINKEIEKQKEQLEELQKQIEDKDKKDELIHKIIKGLVKKGKLNDAVDMVREEKMEKELVKLSG